MVAGITIKAVFQCAVLFTQALHFLFWRRTSRRNLCWWCTRSYIQAGSRLCVFVRRMFAALTGRSLTSQTHPAHWCAPCSARAFGMALPLDQTPRFRSRLIDNFRPDPATRSRPHWLMACICTFVTQVGVSRERRKLLGLTTKYE